MQKINKYINTPSLDNRKTPGKTSESQASAVDLPTKSIQFSMKSLFGDGHELIDEKLQQGSEFKKKVLTDML